MDLVIDNEMPSRIFFAHSPQHFDQIWLAETYLILFWRKKIQTTSFVSGLEKITGNPHIEVLGYLYGMQLKLDQHWFKLRLGINEVHNCYPLDTIKSSERDPGPVLIAAALGWRHNIYSGADQRKHQSSASLVFVRGIYRWPMNSPHK